KSAFNRYAVRRAIQWRRLDEAQRMAGEMMERLGPESSDHLTVMLADMLKTAMFELVQDGQANAKNLMEMCRGLQAAVSAQRGSEEYRAKLQKRFDAQLESALDKAEEVAKEAGLGADRIAAIRKGVLGVGG